MGQTLSEPVTAKETTGCANETFLVGASCMQGWRISMEDAHVHILSLAEDPDAAFFACYDGHGGAKVSQYAAHHLHKNIVNQAEYKNGDIVEAIKKGFLQTDQSMLDDVDMRDELAGTTVITVLVKNKKIYCGNLGDSRAVACINGHTDAMSMDHKPSNDLETKRITAAGGWVEYNRVNGNLALSRALGDFIFKRNDKKPTDEQIVIAVPDVQTRPLTSDLEFILLACDGIWDVMTNEEVVDFVRKRIAKLIDPKDICEELMNRCLAPDCQAGGLGCDNMTVVLVCYLRGETYQELAIRCGSNFQPLIAPALPTCSPPALDDHVPIALPSSEMIKQKAIEAGEDLTAAAFSGSLSSSSATTSPESVLINETSHPACQSPSSLPTSNINESESQAQNMTPILSSSLSPIDSSSVPPADSNTGNEGMNSITLTVA